MIKRRLLSLSLACCLLFTAGCTITIPLDFCNAPASPTRIQDLSDEELFSRIRALNARKDSIHNAIKQQRAWRCYCYKRSSEDRPTSCNHKRRNTDSLKYSLHSINCDLKYYRSESDRRMSLGMFDPEFRPGLGY